MKHHALFIALVALGGCTAQEAGPDDLRDLDVEATTSFELVDELDEDAPQSPEPGTDELTDETDPMAFPLTAQAEPDGESILLTWPTPPDIEHTVCWKETGTWGRPCDHNEASMESGGINYSWSTGHHTYRIPNLECGTEYRIRVNRNWHSWGTATVTTEACSCTPAEHCPYGGWFDGANCSLGEAPAGTTAFVYDGSYYHTPRPSWPFCPIAGSTFDTVNCLYRPVPDGANPFINANHWYYSSECPHE